MKKYNITIHYTGAIDYEIEAENEVKARKKADALFQEESERTLANCIYDCEISDIEEEVADE